MSFQAMTWAIEQKAGGPRAKCVLWSIANYAGPLWFAYPKQELIAEESEQSTDSVQKYLGDLIGMGLVRRIKLKRFGRRTHDFLILGPSPLFQSPIDEILPYLPSGCDVMDDAAANSGSVEPDESGVAPQESEPHAAANSGSVSEATLPPPAVDAADVERQPIDEPVLNLSPTQTLPQGMEAPPLQVGEEENETWKRFERFKKDYPIEVFDVKAAWLWFKVLSETDQETAIVGCRRYGRSCDKLKQRPKHAHKYLRDRIFDGFAVDRTPKPLERKSQEGKAVTTLYTVAGREYLLDELMRATTGGIWYRKPVTPQLAALAHAKPERDWVRVSREQAAAWNTMLDECVECASYRRLVEGSLAPWPWPPRKDGTLSGTPPPTELMTAEDETYMQQEGLK